MKLIAIVTGGTSGIGKSIVEKFTSNNYKVVVIGLDKIKLETVKDQLKDHCDIYSADVSSERDVAGLFQSINDKYKVIDVLVNAAGFFKPIGSQLKINDSIGNWNSIIATNLTGAFLMSIHTAPLLKRPGGRIVNISSIGAFTGGSAGGGVAYSASKAGVNGLTCGFAT